MSWFVLTLSPEFGSTSFGPFAPGPVALGSDPGRCQVVLNPSLGVRPTHAVITPMNANTFVLQPAEQGIGLFYFVGGRGQEQPVGNAVQLRPGDAFAIGSPAGPRFIVGLYTQPAAPASQGFKLGGRSVPTAGQMGQEVKRQTSTSIMTNPVVQEVSKLFWQVRTGAIFQPRVILGFALGLFGFLLAGCAALLRHLVQ